MGYMKHEGPNALLRQEEAQTGFAASDSSPPLEVSVARARALAEGLSASELEFLRGIVAGESQSAIAQRLEVDGAGALTLKQSLMRKLGAEFTADAVRIGIYAGL